MKRVVLFRADGSFLIGLGHVIRCLAFAETLKSHGVDSIFATRDTGSAITDLIAKRGFRFEALNENLSHQDDAAETARLAKKYDAAFVMTDLSHHANVDHPDQYVSFFQAIKAAGYPVVAFDDLSHVRFPFAFQIIPYGGSEKSEVHPEAKGLLGPAYYIASPELVALAQKPREIRRRAEKILISLGGSDPYELTLDVVQAMFRLNHPKLELKVVVGACFSEQTKNKLKALVDDYPGICKLCYQANIPELMLWSDLAITGVGLTRYEAALTGTPILCLTREDLRNFDNDKFIGAGTSQHLTVPGLAQNNILEKEIERLLADFDARNRMSEIGKNLIDGKGCERIISELKKESLL